MPLSFSHTCIALIALKLFFSQPVTAQYEEKNFIRYTVKQGLSEDYITCLNQDDLGYIWIGTEVGLNRFDGKTFKSFFQGSKTLPLLSSSITKIKSFGGGQLGIINRGGFQLLNTKDLSFKNYVIPDTTVFSVYRNRAWDAVELGNHAYAVTTASGFYVFDAPGKPGFLHEAYQLKDIGQKRIAYGRNIFPLGEKEYLVTVEEDDLAFYNEEKRTFKALTQDQKEWLAFNPAVLKKERGLWVRRFQLSKHEFVLLQYPYSNIIYHNRVTNKTIVSPLALPALEFGWESKITALNDSSFLVNGRSSGFYQFHFDKKTGAITADPQKKLADYKIQSLFLDKDKRLWVATSKGVLQQKLAVPVLRSYRMELPPTDLPTGGLHCAYRYKDKLYIGRFSYNYGLIIADTGSKKTITQLQFFGKNTAWNEIRSIQMYHPDTLWIGTSAGLLWFDTKSYRYGKLLDEKSDRSGLHAINILSPVGKDGYAWMCVYLEGVAARYHPASRTCKLFSSKTAPALPFDKIKTIACDAYGDIWISGHSLARWNSKKELFDTIIRVYSGPNKFEDDTKVLVADNKGSLWLHNVQNGLLEYHIKEKRFSSYTMKDGLPSDVFSGFSPVVHDQLWMAGNNQLTLFNTLTKKTMVFDYQDGLPEDKPSGRDLYYDEEGGILYLFNQQVLTTLSLPQAPIPGDDGELIIEEITVNNNYSFFQPGAALKLRHKENNLNLWYTIIDFETDNYQFAYRINNTGSWNMLGQQRSISLNNLQPGSYMIQLKATCKNGAEKSKDFTIIIRPPFWKTVAFYIGSGLLVASGIFYLYRRRIRQVEEKANIDKLLSQTEMKALRSQMNPHFIFNSLNSIREMILHNENKDASHYLSKFAHLIRITLEQSSQSLVSLRNTVDYLQRYMEMEKIRNNLFTYEMRIDQGLNPDEVLVPPMLIQPFIENALWHGVSANDKTIHINIHFEKKADKLVCKIDDNGVGIVQAQQNKPAKGGIYQPYGIENIKKRVSLLNEKYDLKGNIAIRDKKEINGSERGTLVVLQLPLEIKES